MTACEAAGQDQNDGTTDDSENTGGSDAGVRGLPDNSNQEPSDEDDGDDQSGPGLSGSAGALGDPETVQAAGGAHQLGQLSFQLGLGRASRSAASARPRGRTAAGTAGPAVRRARRATPGRRRRAARPSRSPSAARRPADGTPDRSRAAAGRPTPARAARGGTSRTAAARRSPGWGSARREAPSWCRLRVVLPRLGTVDVRDDSSRGHARRTRRGGSRWPKTGPRDDPDRPRLRRPDRGRAARRRRPEVDAVRHRPSARSSPRWTSAPPRSSRAGAARGRRPRPPRLPHRPRPPTRWPAPAPAGSSAGTAGTVPPEWITPAGRRRRRPAGRHRALHAAGQPGRPPDAGVHAVPRRPGRAGPAS